jgi:hypothetical protein
VTLGLLGGTIDDVPPQLAVLAAYAIASSRSAPTTGA